MTKLTPGMKDAIEAAELYPLATASDTGIPNVIPVKFVFIETDEQLWLVDNFMNKTLDNLRQNPHAALYIYSEQDTKTCIQIKGTTSIHTSDDDYLRMKKQVHMINPDAPARSLIVLKVEEVYQCLPGAKAGNKIDCS